MDLQTLSDRTEIIDLISRYNKASIYSERLRGYIVFRWPIINILIGFTKWNNNK
jgi:hypothetical protein